MGIVYSPAALLHKRLAKQSAAERRKHNSSSVNLAGYTRDQIKKRVRESDKFTATEKALLAYVADQNPDKFVFSVKTAQDALSISEYLWVQTRRKLEAKDILAQQMVPLSDGSHHWFLDFDFAPLRDAKYDRPPPRDKQGAKAEPPIYKRVSAGVRARSSKNGGINPLKAQPGAPPTGGLAGMCRAAANDSRRRAAKTAAGQASQQNTSEPTALPTPPAPQGGAGCASCASKIHSTKETESMDEKNFAATKQFFDFLGRHGITRVRLGGQTRKKSDGKRGAVLGFGRPGKPVAEGEPVSTAAAADLAQALLARLQKMGKHRLELVTAAAECHRGLSKSILLDDLNADGVKAAKAIWRGPGAILETSPKNYQAILILAAPMGRPERKSITDQLVARLGADTGAKGALQLHRLPGSINYKQELVEPFVTRLVEYFVGLGDGVQPIKPVAVVRQVAPMCSGVVRPIRKGKRKWAAPPKTPSDEAFRFAVEMLDAGSSAVNVEAALSAPEWLRHHSQRDWPERTRKKAEAFVAGELYGRRGGEDNHA